MALAPAVIPLWRSLAGGGLIGAGAATLSLFNGRIAGISGILAHVLRRDPGADAWRFAFLVGLLIVGLALGTGRPQFGAGPWTLGFAGILVGIGTGTGGGCTSGHGVCGIANESPRSLLATLVFIATAMLTVLGTRDLSLP